MTMKYCTSCGDKISPSQKFCKQCGNSLSTHHKKRFIKTYIYGALSIGVIATILFVIISNRESASENTVISAPRYIVSDRVVNINYPTEENHKNYYSENNYQTADKKKFDSRYYEYNEKSPDFRLVCSYPCPVPKNILEQEFAAITYAIATLRGMAGSDFESEIMPFEVHASEDAVCQISPNYLAYMTTFFDGNNNKRGLLCFFFDKLSYDRTRFPYSTSIHEVTHLFEYGKIEHTPIIWEGLSEVMDSFFLKGNERNSFCWEGNDWYKYRFSNPHDPHDTGRQLFFDLCKNYGFDYQHLPVLFHEIDNQGGNISVKEFIQIINKIVGADTTSLFQKAGVV